jgi:SpoVK/Ycf46/Vps4 family AAA+-type ATPase
MPSERERTAPTFSRDAGTEADASRARAAGVNSAPARFGATEPSRLSWNSLILPESALSLLRRVLAAAREREIAADEWKSGRRAGRPEGLGALFVGARGTGKSTACEVIANELGVALMTVNVGEVLSRYIGETEKNLSRVFAEATSAGAVLLLDEADALFGKRTDVHDSHDRFAAMDVSFFAKRIEAYAGLTVLSVSTRTAIDPGFVRRLAYTVEFPLPGEADRRTLWSRSLPDSRGFAADVDLDFVAAHYPFSGGTIYAVVREAAVLAEAEGAPRTAVAMQHLLSAMVRFG